MSELSQPKVAHTNCKWLIIQTRLTLYTPFLTCACWASNQNGWGHNLIGCERALSVVQAHATPCKASANMALGELRTTGPCWAGLSKSSRCEEAEKYQHDPHIVRGLSTIGKRRAPRGNELPHRHVATSGGLSN